MGRWDYLYELKPVPASEAFVEEASKLIAKDLGVWPLPVEEWSTPKDADRFGPLLAPDSAPPDTATFTAAFRLARLELMHEFEQIDDFMRNERWRDFTPPGRGVELLLFLTHYLTEQMLSIGEATEGRIKRPMLVDLLTRTERHMKARELIVL